MSAIEEFTIRPATAADAAALAAIYRVYVEETVITFDEVPPSADDWAHKIELGYPFLVAERDGAPAGFAYASAWRAKPAYRHTVEDTIYCSRGYTGKGLGTALLGALLERCAEAGFRQVIAVISADGETGGASVALHRKLGFAEVGRLSGVGFKFDRWVDTVFLQRPL